MGEPADLRYLWTAQLSVDPAEQPSSNEVNQASRRIIFSQRRAFKTALAELGTHLLPHRSTRGYWIVAPPVAFKLKVICTVSLNKTPRQAYAFGRNCRNGNKYHFHMSAAETMRHPFLRYNSTGCRCSSKTLFTMVYLQDILLTRILHRDLEP